MWLVIRRNSLDTERLSIVFYLFSSTSASNVIISSKSDLLERMAGPAGKIPALGHWSKSVTLEYCYNHQKTGDFANHSHLRQTTLVRGLATAYPCVSVAQAIQTNVLFLFPSTQFVVQIYHYVFPFLHVSAWWGHLQVHWVSQSPIYFLATFPTLAIVYTLGAHCMYGFYVMMPCVAKCIE
jgi:hypothetical protein